MSEIVSLGAERRDRAGKGPARATRRAGRIPAVIYGDKKDPMLISLEPREFNKELHKPGFFAKLIDITIDGQKHRTLPRDVQFHPVSDAPIHVDFLRVAASTQIHVSVPVHFVNHEKSVGLKRGGILNIVRHEVELVCTADHIPDHLTVDLDGLDIGDSVHISKVSLPEGVHTAITGRDFTIATVAPPTVHREEAAETTEG
jgi:large subunit ribosomal protein L25